ncbi:MAG: lysophospholipid acyltransferase family protein [Neomegalonema sp.]|nr:lysophospholipid acyltransferase family protein [Neomegalonema sp.]
MTLNPSPSGATALPAFDAREVSYASSAETRAGRAIVRGLENVTGRKQLVEALQNYRTGMATGKSFWEALWGTFGFALDLPGGGLDCIPREGPVVCVANHPYGILDGLALGVILQKTRPDFKILANDWLVAAPEIAHHVLPIERAPTREAMRTNLETRRQALAHLRQGGCIAVFPAGTVSMAEKILRPASAFDASWKTFAATMIVASGAKVTPILFEGQNSRLFQIASHLNPALRLGLFIHEFKKRVGDKVRVWIGDPAPQELIDENRNDPKRLMELLRSHTYSLSPDLITRLTTGKAWGDPAPKPRS